MPRHATLSSSVIRLRWEVVLVLALSLGQSAVYSIVQFADKASRGPISQATSTLNQAQSSREFFDFTYQFLSIFFALVPVALALYFLSTYRGTRDPFRSLGFDFRRPGRDLLQGVGVFAVIAAGSLALYAAGRALGITTAIIPAADTPYWWTIPMLILSALRHAVLEEVIMIGYLFRRGSQMGIDRWKVVVVSALIRGTYHLYQGIGPFIGNVVMGLVFGWLYTRTRRVMPLVMTHALLDIGAFVGFSLFGKAIGLG